MADTQRTIADIQTLLADNSTRDISPQDLRDFLVTSAFTREVRAVSAATVLTSAVDWLVECDATTAAFTVTLPAVTARREFVFIKTDVSANAITIDGNGAETINGAVTQSLAAQYDTIHIIGNAAGTAWLII